MEQLELERCLLHFKIVLLLQIPSSYWVVDQWTGGGVNTMKTIKRFTMSDKGVLKDTVDQIVCSQARYSLYIGKGFFFWM